MNLESLKERSGLETETIKYYVSSKLVEPLYTEKKQLTYAEFSDYDLIVLKAASKMRRLGLSMDEVMRVLHSPGLAAGIILKQYQKLYEDVKKISECTSYLDEIDLSDFKDESEIIRKISELDIRLDLPPRDLNNDLESELRTKLEERIQNEEELRKKLAELGKQSRKRLIFASVFFLLFALCLGFILGPYFIW